MTTSVVSNTAAAAAVHPQLQRTERRACGGVNPNLLCGVAAFSALSAAQRAAIAARCRRLRCPPGRQVVTLQAASRDVFFIVSGQLQATVFSASGRQVLLQDLGPGEMFGELAALDGEPRAAHVVAHSEALLVAMSDADFRAAVAQHASVREVTVKRLCTMVRMLSGRVFEASALAVKHRLHAELLRLVLGPSGVPLAGAGGGVLIEPAPTHAELASRIGTHREGVTRELNRLRRAGVVAGGRRRLEVLQPQRLRDMLRQATG